MWFLLNLENQRSINDGKSLVKNLREAKTDFSPISLSLSLSLSVLSK